MTASLASPLPTSVADALRDRIRTGADLAAFVGASVRLAVAGVNLLRGTPHEPVVAIVVMVSLAATGFLGLIRRARWTPVGYVALLMIANVVNLASYGVWFGLGTIYVLTTALAFLFMSRRWSLAVGIGLVTTPLILGILFSLHVLQDRPSLALDDVNAWRRAGSAAITALVAIAIIVSFAVRQMVNGRRGIEAAAVVARAQRLERARLENQIAHARRADSIAQLAAEVGADIGAALAIIQARGYALAAELHSAEARECLNDIKEAANSAGSTMRSLTAFAPDAKLTARGNASDAVHALPKLLRRTIPSRIALEVAAEPDAWVGIGATDLARICANLVLNARDAIANAGTIAVHVVRDAAHVVIEVRDTGTGMSEATLSHLFQPFFTTKPVGRGTGLGLATTRILVERAAGTIAVASEVGRGTTFTIRLPLLDAPP